jgi:uncharacterized membrane protein
MITWIIVTVIAIMVGLKLGGAMNDWTANQAAERKEREAREKRERDAEPQYLTEEQFRKITGKSE